MRQTGGISLIVATPADAVMLFGNVGEIEEVRERPGDRQCGVQRQVGQIIGEVSEGVLIAVTSGLCHCADVLDDLIDRFTFERAKGLAEQLAQQPDVIAKRFMRIVHSPTRTIAPSVPSDRVSRMRTASRVNATSLRPQPLFRTCSGHRGWHIL